MQFFSNSTNNSIQSIRKFIMNYDQNFNINNCALNNYSKNEIISFYNGIFQSNTKLFINKLPHSNFFFTQKKFFITWISGRTFSTKTKRYVEVFVYSRSGKIFF